MMSNGQEILLFGGNANPELAEKIASYLGRPLGQMICTRFADGECACRCWRARAEWMCSSYSPPARL
jgi:phosphoribosylpyrophosphate synthetase